MRILEIEDFFHPDAGYQINVISKYFANCGHQVTIASAEISNAPSFLTGYFGTEGLDSRDARYSEETGVSIVRIKCKRWISSRAILDRRELYDAIKRVNPDVIFVHGVSTYTAMRLIWNYKKLPPLVSDNHMTKMASSNRLAGLFNRVFKLLFASTINREKIPVFRLGAEDTYLSDYLGVSRDCIVDSSLGSDLQHFKPDEKEKALVRRELGIPLGAFVVTYAGKLDQHKGALFFANAIKQSIISSKEMVFLVIGDSTGECAYEVEALLKESENRVIRLQTQPYLQLPRYLQASDVFLIPRQCSLTLFDAQACGLPVIAEDNDINEKRLSFDNGFLFRAGDCDSLRNTLANVADLNQVEIKRMGARGRSRVSETCSYETISAEMLDVITAQVDK